MLLCVLREFFFSSKDEEGRGEEGTRKEEKKKGRRKRRSGRCSWPLGSQKKGSSQASTQRKPTQESQPTEAPNSARKRKEKKKAKRRDRKDRREEGTRQTADGLEVYILVSMRLLMRLSLARRMESPRLEHSGDWLALARDGMQRKWLR